MDDQGRNAICGCGSGKKFKNCCVHKQPESQKVLYSIGAVLAVGLVWGMASAVKRANDPTPEPPAGQVWSEEHGHFHDTPIGLETPGSASGTGSGSGNAGQVWSEEHNHFHDAPAATPSAGNATPPAALASDPPESSPN